MALLRRPFLVAILLHVALFVGLARYSMPVARTTDQRTPTSSQPAQSAASTGAYTAQNAPYSLAEMQTRLDASIVAAQRLPATQQFEAAGDYARRLESVSSVASMKEIGAYLRNATTSKPRVSRAEPGRETEFDHATSTPAGAREIGNGRYVFVFKDANGNTFEQPAAQAEENAARAFALLDRSDVLREFKNSILLPALQQRLDTP